MSTQTQLEAPLRSPTVGESLSTLAATERHRSKPSIRSPSLRRRTLVDRAALPVILIAAFGPYLSSTIGIRSEQLVVYIALLAALPRVATSTRFSRPISTIVITWLGIAAIGTIVGLDRATDGLQLIAGIDAVLAPVATLLVISVVDRSTLSAEYVDQLQRLTVGLVALNSCVSLSMTVFPIEEFLNTYFWAAGTESSTASRSAGATRLTGLFGSPFGAGFAYSAALIILTRLLLLGKVGAVAGGGAGLLLLAGGVLPSSKAFLLLGIPLTIVIVVTQRGPKRSRLVLGFASVSLATYLFLEATGWTKTTAGRGAGNLLQGSGERGLVRLYSGGRYDSDAPLLELAQAGWSQARYFGFGVQGLGPPLDNTWVEVFIRAGLVGVLLLAISYASLVRLALRVPRAARVDRATAIALVSLLALCSLGGPTLTQNRAGTIFIINTFALLSVTGWKGRSSG